MNLDGLAPRSGQPAPAPLAALRERMGEAAARFPVDVAASVRRRRIGDTAGGVDALVIATPGSTRTLVYFHGGGFRLGSPEISAGFLSQVAVAARLDVVLPYYSLAPEAPFPAALLEGSTVLRAVAAEAEADGRTLLLGGDSAGGNLATVLALTHAGVVRRLLLLSPWLDLRVEAGSFAYNRATDPVFGREAAAAAAALYLQGHAADDPRVSPVLAALTALPPTLILAGSGEVLLDDVLLFTQRAAAAGRSLSLHLLVGMTHVEPVIRPDSAFAAEALRLCAAFCRSS